MEITEVRVYPVREEKLKAFVSIVLDRCFMVNDIKVIQGKSGLFISMPSRRKKNGEFKDVAHPLNQQTRSWVEQRILGEYHSVVDGAQPAPAAAAKQETAQPLSGESAEPSLEEVERAHLNDSFWGVG